MSIVNSPIKQWANCYGIMLIISAVGSSCNFKYLTTLSCYWNVPFYGEQ